MLVVLAGRNDPAARSLVARWSESGHDARVMTCADLSCPGWFVQTAAPLQAAAVIGGQLTPLSAMKGVLVRLPCVSEAELPHIATDDRAFVASEMHAFLTYWLSNLPCRVLNRTSHAGFGGPVWTREQWVLHAAELDVPARAVRRRARLGEDSEPELTARPTVTVVGGRCIGSSAPILCDRAVRLAAASQSDVLAVHFDGDGPEAQFLEADAWVDVWDPLIGDALLSCFVDGAGC